MFCWRFLPSKIFILFLFFVFLHEAVSQDFNHIRGSQAKTDEERAEERRTTERVINELNKERLFASNFTHPCEADRLSFCSTLPASSQYGLMSPSLTTCLASFLGKLLPKCRVLIDEGVQCVDDWKKFCSTSAPYSSFETLICLNHQRPSLNVKCIGALLLFPLPDLSGAGSACLGWRSTMDLDPTGERNYSGDFPCSKLIEANEVGFCECESVSGDIYYRHAMTTPRGREWGAPAGQVLPPEIPIVGRSVARVRPGHFPFYCEEMCAGFGTAQHRETNHTNNYVGEAEMYQRQQILLKHWNLALSAPPPIKPFANGTRCLRWRSTPECDMLSTFRQKKADMSCSQKIPRHQSGYCECEGAGVGTIRRTGFVDCRHELFTCNEYCGVPMNYDIPEELFVRQWNGYSPSDKNAYISKCPAPERALPKNHSNIYTGMCKIKAKKYGEPDTAALEKIRSKTYFIALNLHNNEAVLFHILYELLRLILFLGPERSYVSIYESGSVDRTGAWLQLFDETLDSIGVPHQIRLDQKEVRGGLHRIDWLAHVRNHAMYPLYMSAPGTWDRLIFLNDVYFCMEDIRHLLLHDVDMACGMDFVERPVPGGARRIVFYDMWVSRSRSGAKISHNFPYFQDLRSVNRLRAGLPVPSQICWNGGIVATAEPFYNGLRFRGRFEDECGASECTLLPADFIRMGFNKIVIDPQVQLTYRRETACTIINGLEGIDTTPATLASANPNSINWDDWPVFDRYWCEPLINASKSSPDAPQYWEKYLHTGESYWEVSPTMIDYVTKRLHPEMYPDSMTIVGQLSPEAPTPAKKP